MGPGTVLNAILQVMNAAGNIVFANLPIIFAMGVAIGMAKKEKEVAALAAAIAFFIMHASISAMIDINGGTEVLLEGLLLLSVVLHPSDGCVWWYYCRTWAWQHFITGFIRSNCHRCCLSLEVLALCRLSRVWFMLLWVF